jgi:hypothetical protein
MQQLFTQPVRKRVALHEHHGVDGVVEDVRRLLQAIPGLELVSIPQLHDHGHQCAGFRNAPIAKQNVHRTVLEHAAAAGVDVLAGIYHSCHRELAAAEQDYPFAVQNFISLVGEAMGITREISTSACYLSRHRACPGRSCPIHPGQQRRSCPRPADVAQRIVGWVRGSRG